MSKDGDGAVLGMGGLFFRSPDPQALADWYREHLGLGAGCGIAAERRAEWDSSETGHFARIHDPDGNAIELWEPPA